MTEEEKEAIDDCKNFMNVGDYIGEKEYKELQIAINYIEKLQKENQELEKTIEQSLVEQKERDKYTHELEQRLEKLQKENKTLKEKLKEYEIGKEQQ